MLEVVNLSYRHAAHLPWVFYRHSFQLKPGEIGAIIGPNGRGKTTLLKNVLGLLKPETGRVRFGGVPGYVPQGLDAAFPYRVRDMVVMGRARNIRMFSAPGRADYQRADAALATVGASELAQRRMTELSGGQRQLVLIARALASDCDILILDEPTSALDYQNQDRILSILADASRRGMTVLFTTHSPQHAQSIAHRVLLMQNSQHYEFGPCEAVLTEERLGALYGIDIKTLPFEHNGKTHRAVVAVFG